MSDVNKERPRDVRVDRFSFSVRLASIFFPIESGEALDVSRKVGFVLISELPPEVPTGARIIIGGTIARKGDCSIFMDPDRGVLGVRGKHVLEVLSYFDQIQDLIKADLNIDLDADARFYEISAELSITTGKDPIAATTRLFANSKDLARLGRLVDAEVSSYGIRLVPANHAPTGEEWFDYRIEPQVTKPRSEYHSVVVYRSRTKANVVTVSQTLEDRVKNLIKAIEEGLES